VFGLPFFFDDVVDMTMDRVVVRTHRESAEPL
jgi:hypothetical protein